MKSNLILINLNQPILAGITSQTLVERTYPYPLGLVTLVYCQGGSYYCQAHDDAGRLDGYARMSGFGREDLFPCGHGLRGPQVGELTDFALITLADGVASLQIAGWPMIADAICSPGFGETERALATRPHEELGVASFITKDLATFVANCPFAQCPFGLERHAVALRRWSITRAKQATASAIALTPRAPGKSDMRFGGLN